MNLLNYSANVFERRHQLDDDLETLLKSTVPLGVLSDIITHALGLPSASKQGLLAEPRVANGREKRPASLLLQHRRQR